MFKNLRRECHLSVKQLNCYSFKYKKACNLGKLYLLPKIHKRLYNIPGRPVLSTCAPPQIKHQNILIIISNLSYRIVGLKSGIQEIL